MEKRRRHDHAGEKTNAVRVEGHLRPVGCPVEETRQRDKTDSEAQGQPDRACQEQAERENGGKDPSIHAAWRVSGDPDGRADRHGPDKGRRKGPARPSAKEGRPHANREHGEQVVPASERMDKTSRKVGGAVAGMRLGEGGGQQKHREQPPE